MNTKVCTQGHPMDADEQECSVCGSPVATTPTPAVIQPPPPTAPATGAPEKCANCKKLMAADATFCETCGAERTAPSDPSAASSPAPTQSQWFCTLAVDPVFWHKAFPTRPVPASRDFLLTAGQVSIGRYSSDRGLPDIDLDEDIAASRHHAELIREADGSYSINLFSVSSKSYLDGVVLELGKPQLIEAGATLKLGEFSSLTFACH